MKFTDTEAEVIAFLTDRLDGVPVALRVPTARPGTFVRVWGSGGDGINRVLDDVQLTVEAWAEDDEEAGLLALKARDLLLNASSVLPFVRRVQATRPYFAPDVVSEIPRYRFTARLRVRAAR